MEIFVLRDGQQTGPFTEDTVQSLFARGGLAPGDMAWRKGLPAWMPLAEVLNPGSERPSSPPPAPTSGVRPPPKKSATAKQKALLKYVGATFEENISREDAAVAISDAMENPKFAARMQKWADEKLRLHPEIFQDEIDHRRSTRVARYLEKCQSDAAEAVKDVTKAHVQVLVESLDKKNPSWEREPRAALWEHLLPAIAEHFPQLVKPEWKGHFKRGSSGSRIAAAVAAGQQLHKEEPSPGPISAAIRGLVYGAIVLGLILGAIFLFRNNESTTNPGQPKSGGPTTPATPAPTPGNAAVTPPEGTPPVHPTEVPAITANPVEPAVPAVPAAPPVGNDPAGPNGANPAANPNVAVAPAPVPATPPASPANPAVPLNTPPVPPPGGTNNNVPPAPAPTPAPAEPAPAPPGVKNLLTITKSVSVQLQFGVVTLNPGTRVRYIALEGQNVRVNFNNNVILVPAQATDVDPNALPPAPTPAPTAAPTVPVAPAPAPAPVAKPIGQPKPSSDL
jgi:hypothetical protein